MSKGLYALGVLAFAALVSYFLLGAIFTISGLLLIAAVTLTIKGYSKKYGGGIPFPSQKTAKIAGPALLAYAVLSLGIFGFPAIFPSIDSVLGMFGGTTASVIGPPVTEQQVTASTAACSAALSPEEKDAVATVTLDAFDVEALAGKSSAVDLGDDCRLYANSNTGTFTPSADTAAGSVTTVWKPGDTAFIYCGGTFAEIGYYADPVEGECIDSIAKHVSWDVHAITTAASGVDMVVYDDAHTVLTAAGNTTTADYDITLGASQEKKIYVKLTESVAVKSFNLMAFATASLNDIDYVKPESSTGMVQKLAPKWLKDVEVGDETNIQNQTTDYDVYYLAQPVLLKQWQSVEYPFTVKAKTTDPAETANVFSTMDAAIICAIDGTYHQGSDGKEYLDIQDHITDTEANVGYVEVVFDPVGGYECSVLEGQ
jgi:hypothetical protein